MSKSIFIALICLLAVFLIHSLPGCATVDDVKVKIDAYCDGISKSKKEYRDCLNRLLQAPAGLPGSATAAAE